LIRGSERLREFERWYTSSHLAGRSYHDSLAIFAAMWRYAREMNQSFPGDWERDIEADIELARVLNGLPDQR
jgi:hypothetical protein